MNRTYTYAECIGFWDREVGEPKPERSTKRLSGSPIFQISIIGIVFSFLIHEIHMINIFYFAPLFALILFGCVKLFTWIFKMEPGYTLEQIAERRSHRIWKAGNVVLSVLIIGSMIGVLVYKIWVK